MREGWGIDGERDEREMRDREEMREIYIREIDMIEMVMQSAAADTRWPDPRPVPVSVTMIITAASIWEMRPMFTVPILTPAPR